MKWYTETEVIDVETGEIHNGKINWNIYIKIKKHENKYEINGNTGIRKITYECRKRGEQLKLELDEI